MSNKESRKQFEEWIKSKGCSTTKKVCNKGLVYVEAYTREAWLSWKAAREKLPKIKLPEYLESYDNGELNSYNQGFNAGVLSANKAINETGYEVKE